MINIAQFGLLILLSLLLLLHFIILLKIIPYTVIWGGRLKSNNEMYRFEILSVFIISLFIMVIMTQAGFTKLTIPNNLITYALLIMTGLFLLNTFGNAVSKNKIERLLFIPITILLTIFSLILALLN